MEAGRLRHRVELQSRVDSLDGYGDSPPVWSGGPIVFAAIDPRAGSERFESQTVNPEVTHVITMRYRSDLTAAMRIVLGERIFEIESVLNAGERDRQTIALCIERTEERI